jgi:hypothetical protein
VAHRTPNHIAELSGLRGEVVTATGAHKRALIRRLRAVEACALGQSLEAAEAGHRSEIEECLDQARADDLFGQRRGLDRQLHARLRQLRIEVQRIRQARRRLARDGELPWFHYQSHFADVFSRGGFDIVIGNPPWLRSEAIPVEMRRRLAGRYRWWRATGRCYGNFPDLAVAFVERALELAAPNGVVAMLVPSKIASAGYGATARHALASITTLHAVADLTGSAGAAFDATVYPLALIMRKTAPAPLHRVRTSLPRKDGNGVRQSELRGGGPWILVRNGVGSVVAALEHDHPHLGDRITCHLGLKTGINRVFLNPPNHLEPEVLRWAVRGRDLRPFRCHCRVRLLWTHDAWGSPRSELPPQAAAYLKSHDAALRARRDFQGGPSWVVFRARPAVARYRVVWADLARRLAAATLSTAGDVDRIPLNSCYVAPVQSGAKAQAITAWLNSTWLRAAARLGAVPASSGFARFNAQVVARLPLPDSALADPGLSRLARAGRAGAVVQEELDDLVSRHLGLSSSAQSALRAVLVGATGDRR